MSNEKGGVVLFAWIGEDELGSGEVGLKHALTELGDWPLVSTRQHRMTRDLVVQQLQQQADRYGKTIRLCRYVQVEEVLRITPGRGIAAGKGAT